MDSDLTHIVIVLAVSMVIALLARRLRLPYTVGLVVVGCILAFSKLNFGLVLTHDLIFDVILPPLLFESALNLRWRDLRADFPPILVLSILGTIIAAAAVAGGTIFLLGWPLAAALVFGSLIAATDPVAVIAMFKDNAVSGRLRLLVESESLFNDGIAAVLFTAALAWTQSGAASMGSPMTIAGSLALTAFGGLAAGTACGLLGIAAVGRSSEHLVEAALTTVVAYGSFLLAERLQVSGVLATVAAGLVMGNLGVLREEEKSPLSLKGREFVLDFWEFAAFLVNSIVFPLIGANVATISLKTLSETPVLALLVIVLVSRGLTVYPLSLAFSRSKWAITPGEQHVLWWGGLRGALGLALVLSLPPRMTMRDELVVATFGIVVFSIVAQGLTMPLLLRRFGFLRPPRALP